MPPNSNSRLLTYPEVHERMDGGRTHLLLGNGFSIACDRMFRYDKLRDFAKVIDDREDVLFYTKLPTSFSVDTPAGRHSPDWALAASVRRQTGDASACT